MSDRDYDPFEAWRAYTMNEDLDIKKLHTPGDFLQEVTEFINETSAASKAIQAFIDSPAGQGLDNAHGVSALMKIVGSSFKKIDENVKEIQKNLYELKDELHMVANRESNPGSGKAFKKI